MTALLHLSDPHFGTERTEVVDALERFVREQAFEIVVVSGDITQRARRPQFEAAQELIDRLGISTALVIPGNHDIPLFNLGARVFAPYANYRRSFDADLEPTFESERWLIVTLNTTRPRRHKDGEISVEQIERTARRLERALSTQLRIVVLHHPTAVIRQVDEVNLVHGREVAVRRWADAGADLILGGHIHLPYVAPLHEHFVGLPRKMWAVQAGTAVSNRVRHEADNSFNVIRNPPASGGASVRTAVVERWDIVAASGRFELRSVQTLALHHDQRRPSYKPI